VGSLRIICLGLYRHHRLVAAAEGVRKRLTVLGCDIPDKPQRGPAALHALVKSEIARWSPIIKAAGVTIN
jgi:tripartite-type tricarboxylate transporter receptor subunit TctC